MPESVTLSRPRPRLVELLGPSGVGKTTVLKLARELSPDPESWLGPEQIEPMLRARDRFALDRPELRDYLNGCLDLARGSAMLPSQAFAFLEMLKKACLTALAVQELREPRPLLHDELLLHRAFSVLPMSCDVEADARWYFATVPAPHAAIVFVATPEQIVERTLARGSLPNCYRGLDPDALLATARRLVSACAIAADTLGRRGVDVHCIDTGAAPRECAGRLLQLLQHQIDWRA